MLESLGRDEERPTSAGQHLHNVPVQLTSFVGREYELARALELLGGARLLTFTGAGGAGKTRLAFEVAKRLAQEGRYPGGVWLVELAALADPRLVLQSVASALGLREELGRPLTDTLVDALGARPLLLILDNCEHLVEACALLVDKLLRACPKLTILTASREALGVPGEVAWRVPSLGVPESGMAVHVDSLMRCEAIRLLVERASAAQPGFELSERNAQAATDVCRRLDGMPLAIELAAARISVLTVEQIAARLDDCFKLLTRGNRTAMPRQQTLRATVDWSYDLLPEPERVLFRRLAVFAGGWTLEVAEAVCSYQPLAAEQVLDLLAQLVAKSLVHAEERGGAGRYRLLEPIRQYAAARLAEVADDRTLRKQHCARFLQLAEHGEPALWGPRQAEWLERLEGEHDNLRTALEWSRAQGEGETMVRLALALVRFWDIRGYVREGRRWLDLALDLEPARPTVARARALIGVAYLSVLQGSLSAATARLEEGLALAQDLAHVESIGAAHLVLGMVARVEGDYERAAALFEISLTMSRKADHKPGVYTSLYLLASTARFLGEHERAAALHAESLALKREHGDAWSVAASLFSMGTLVRIQGDEEQAARLFRESLALRRELKDREGIAVCLEGLAHVVRMPSSVVQAVTLLGAAHRLRETIGQTRRAQDDRLVADARSMLGEHAFTEAWTLGQMMPLDDLIDQVLPGGSPPPFHADVVRVEGLTPRETEVAALVARGLTNKQIAETLVIAEGTAEKHVANIMGRLDLKSRAQIAVWAANHGLIHRTLS
jgi:predicted ATPase/DNA-binding CsgD family transcriptional regulator